MYLFRLTALLAIFAPALPEHLHAQTELLSVYYNQLTRLRGDNSLSGPTILHVREHESVYVHTSAPEESYVEKTELTIAFVPGDPDGFPIYKNTRTDSLVYATTLGVREEQYCVVRDTLTAITWALSDPLETKTFGSYTGHLAYGWHGDRLYETWFTPDIPLDHGPHKLHGLPGLILEATSVDGIVSFTFDRLDVHSGPTEPNPIALPAADVTFSGREEYLAQEESMAQQFMKRMRSEGNTGITRHTPYADSQIERLPGGYDPDADPDDEIPPNN